MRHQPIFSPWKAVMSRIVPRRVLIGTLAALALAVPLSECGDSDGCLQGICITDPGGGEGALAPIDASH